MLPTIQSQNLRGWLALSTLPITRPEPFILHNMKYPAPLSGHLIDGIVFPGVLDHRKPDLVARPGDIHRLVVDLHRFDYLFEVRGVALNVNAVTFM